MKRKLVKIAIPNSIDRLFTYYLPNDYQRKLEPGRRCLVPFGRRKLIGFIIEQTDEKPAIALKTVSKILDEKNYFSPSYYKFMKWISEYYYCNIADVLYAALPPGLRKNQTVKLSSVTQTPGQVLLGYRLHSEDEKDDDCQYLNAFFKQKQMLSRKELIDSGLSAYKFGKFVKNGLLAPQFGLPQLFDYIRPRENVLDLKPNAEQKKAIKSILELSSSFNPILLFGITGSGKTLVYCHIVREVLRRNQTVLILVPEIALAGTLLAYFKSFFEEETALLHSGLTDKERTLIWHNISEGKIKIIIGARSALLAPLANPGLIIVDEEHDESYKQDEPNPRFQARDAAVMRAKMLDIPIILGSASPAVETMHNALSGRYHLVQLTRRPEHAEIPLTRMIDLKEERSISGKSPYYTPTLIDKLNQIVANKHQAILYINRRGFSPRVKCLECGHTPECPHCNISLSFHRADKRLICHYCGYFQIKYNECDNCKGDEFIYIGTGTQKVEEHIGELVPGAKIIRLDSDAAVARKKAHEILSDFAAKKYNILLGTQMVSKGIDFPDVSLVGILMADIGIDMPDFRADEKLFAKLLQVSGRSGRGIVPGEVIIQTFNPQHDLLDDAARQDYNTFYERTVETRKKLKYPPFAHLIKIRFQSKIEEDGRKYILIFMKNLQKQLDRAGIKVHLLGPSECPLYRLRGVYRRQIFIKTRQIMSLNKLLSLWRLEQDNYGVPPRVKIIFDIDPYDMM